jgi:hypothetical protein
MEQMGRRGNSWEGDGIAGKERKRLERRGKS